MRVPYHAYAPYSKDVAHYEVIFSDTVRWFADIPESTPDQFDKFLQATAELF
jgi:hypothetical protein